MHISATSLKYIVFDIDGTLADNSHRQHYLLPPVVTVKQSINDWGIQKCSYCDAELGKAHAKACPDLSGWKKDWDSFFSDEETMKDKVVPSTGHLAFTLSSVLFLKNIHTAFLTARPERCREATTAWLTKQHFLYTPKLQPLIMRPDGDFTDDHIWKIETAKRELGLENILYVFEDRKRVVSAWREAGVFCFDVGGGDF